MATFRAKRGIVPAILLLSFMHILGGCKYRESNFYMINKSDKEVHMWVDWRDKDPLGCTPENKLAPGDFRLVSDDVGWMHDSEEDYDFEYYTIYVGWDGQVKQSYTHSVKGETKATWDGVKLEVYTAAEL
jgi:hypothetical protein